MPFRKQGAGLGHPPRAVCSNEHPRQTRMDWQPQHGATDVGEGAIPGCDEPRKEAQCRVNSFLGRTLEPLETPGIPAPRDDIEDGAREIDSEDLRFAVRAQPIARVPQPPNDTGTGPRG